MSLPTLWFICKYGLSNLRKWVSQGVAKCDKAARSQVAYEGFPPSIVRLKQQIDENVGALAKENPGSLWPKTSIGALRDNRRLTPDELRCLKTACEVANEKLRMLSEEDAGPVVL